MQGNAFRTIAVVIQKLKYSSMYKHKVLAGKRSIAQLQAGHKIYFRINKKTKFGISIA